MLKHFRWMGTAGNDMLVVLSAIQLLSGLCEPIMEEVETDLSFLGISWFLHHRKRLREMDGKMWIEHQWSPTLQRVNDQAVMKSFAGIEGITIPKLEKANYCRLYLRIITISDLADERGASIPGDRMDGKWRADSDLEWPLLPCPPANYWATFRWCIRKAFVTLRRPGRLNKKVLLDKPLGSWKDTDRHIQHQYYRTQGQAFNRWGDNFLQYKASINNKTFEADGITTLPPQAMPIQARHSESELWTSEAYHMCRAHTPQTQQATITTSSTDGPDMAASDGSVDILKGDRASAAIVHHNGKRYETATRFQSCDYSTSYRSEIEEISDTIDLLKEANITESIAQFVDNSMAVKNVNRPFTSPAQMLAPEADILLHCHHKKQQLQAPLDLQWVRAHQDDGKKKEDLPPEEVQLNIEYDERSKEFRVHDEVTYKTAYEGSGAMLIINNKWVTTKYKLQIQEASTLKAHKAFFLKKYQSKTLDDYNSIYWRGIGMARRNLTLKEDTNLTKHMNGWLNTGKQKGHFGHASECPGCGWHEETQLHIKGSYCSQSSIQNNDQLLPREEHPSLGGETLYPHVQQHLQQKFE